MDFSNKKVEGLAQKYDAVLEGREGKEDLLRQVNAKIGGLEEQEVEGAVDFKALDAARTEQTQLRRQIEAVDRVLEKIQQNLSGAFSDELTLQAHNLPSLRREVAELRLAGAKALGKYLAGLQFIQNPEGVFGPDEIVAAVLWPLAGRKSEPSYYSDVLAEVQKSAIHEAGILRETCPEMTNFRELTRKMRFLESWAGPPPQEAKNPAEWSAGERIAAIRNREQHLHVLVMKAIAGQKRLLRAKTHGRGGPGPIE